MNALIPIEHQKQRILTTKQLAEIYQTTEGNISNNFNNHIEHFIEGKHYHLLEGEALKEFKRDSYGKGIAPNVNKLYLWTERGANRHCKILDTDKAWEQFDELEETYFKTKLNAPMQALSPQLQLLITMELRQGEPEAAITETKEEVQGIRDVVSLSSTSWRKDTKNLITKMAHKLGGNEYIRDLRNESYKLLDARMGVSLETRLTNKRRRMTEEGISKSKRDELNYLDVIVDDKKLIEGYVAIVKEMAIKYGI